MVTSRDCQADSRCRIVLKKAFECYMCGKGVNNGYHGNGDGRHTSVWSPSSGYIMLFREVRTAFSSSSLDE